MANKKKSKSPAKGKRKVSGVKIKFNPITTAFEIGGLALGAYGGVLLQKKFPNLKYADYIQAAIGVMLKDNKLPLLRGVGYAMIYTGGMGIAQQLGLLNRASAASQMPPALPPGSEVKPAATVNGYAQIPFDYGSGYGQVGGVKTTRFVAGIPTTLYTGTPMPNFTGKTRAGMPGVMK